MKQDKILLYPSMGKIQYTSKYEKPRRLTQYVFRAQLPQILELEVDVNNGHTACDSEDDYVTAVGFL